MSKTGWIVGLGIAAVAAGSFYFVSKSKPAEARYRMEAVERGDVVATVTASGTLSAVTTVKVGSQVSGIIAKLHVDFNSEVREGQLLAELDPTPFQAAVDQRQADLTRQKVELRSAEVTFARSRALLEQQLLSKAEYDVAEANRDATRAAVVQSEAALSQAKTNLAYTRITSPIDGVVVDRQYDIGQTVAASFQAPTLFTIAKDLTRMQVATNIDEADIGRVQVGQAATFTVDAFPDGRFRGAVSQIRLSPQTVQNVVTYPVLLDVQNPELKLKPGMTANVLIPVDVRKETLKVPNAALRFRPPVQAGSEAKANGNGKPTPKPEPKAEASPTPGEKAPEDTAAPGATRPGSPGQAGGEARAGRGQGRPGRDGAAGGSSTGRREGGSGAGWSGRGGAEGRRGGSRTGTVWVDQAGKLKPIVVKTSITDGNYTAIESDELKEGTEIVVGLATSKAQTAGGGMGGVGGGPGRRM